MPTESDEVWEFPLFRPSGYGFGGDAQEAGDFARGVVVVLAVGGGFLQGRHFRSSLSRGCTRPIGKSGEKVKPRLQLRDQPLYSGLQPVGTDVAAAEA